MTSSPSETRNWVGETAYVTPSLVAISVPSELRVIGRCSEASSLSRTPRYSSPPSAFTQIATSDLAVRP
ncbi:hypothetical protein B1R94_13365 [Mycolicibacterium litorale]|nr:hypothetical protein B1R94_13365 [Mycolicibacterium litorale]